MSSLKNSGGLDPRTYRRHFKHVWQQYITENFATPAHAAVCFGVDPSTAENWFAGSNAPQGWCVGHALSDPDLRERALAAMGGQS